MIAAIPVSQDRTDALIDERFGRCPFFCFYNTKTDSCTFKENKIRDASGGVGPQVVEFLASNGISEIYAIEVGPKAQQMLDRLKIGTNLVTSNQTISQIINNSIKEKSAKKEIP